MFAVFERVRGAHSKVSHGFLLLEDLSTYLGNGSYMVESRLEFIEGCYRVFEDITGGLDFALIWVPSLTLGCPTVGWATVVARREE